MTDVLLSAKNLSVRFGGVLAVNDVSFDVRRGEVFTLIGPNGAGKTTVFNLISRFYQPTQGRIDYAGAQGMVKLTEQPPHQVASLGIARTFQNIELFEHASVLHNLLVGRHTHRQGAEFGHLGEGDHVGGGHCYLLEMCRSVEWCRSGARPDLEFDRQEDLPIGIVGVHGQPCGQPSLLSDRLAHGGETEEAGVR